MLNTPVGRLRAVGLAEGVSFLVLLGIAMPLKYLAGIPEMVRVVGMLHGVLWIAFLACVGEVWAAHRWPLSRIAFALVCSVLPGGTFVLDTRLRGEWAAAPALPRPQA